MLTQQVISPLFEDFVESIRICRAILECAKYRQLYVVISSAIKKMAPSNLILMFFHFYRCVLQNSRQIFNCSLGRKSNKSPK